MLLWNKLDYLYCFCLYICLFWIVIAVLLIIIILPFGSGIVLTAPITSIMVTRSTLDVPTLANQLHSKHQSACSRVDQCPMLITFSLETYFMFIDLRPRSIRFLVDFAPFCLETSTCYESRYISLCVLDIIVCSRYTNLLLLGKGGWVGRGGGKRALL